MFTVIPVLPVNEPCHWCDGQQCYTASVWWGPCLLAFYTTDETRLEPNKLNDAACEVLIELTKAIKPGSDLVIDGEEMWGAIGNCGCLTCHWPDYVPPVLIARTSWVCIPLEPSGEEAA